MGCLEENTLIAFVGRALPSDTHSEVIEHVDGCSDCRQILAHVSHLMLSGLGDEAQVDSSSPSLLTEGQKVGPYVILRPLGSGSMGAVYLAYDPRLDRRVAFKLLGSELVDLDREAGRRRFAREAQAMARLSHPNVIAVYDSGILHGRPFLVMEYLEGQTFAQWLAERPRSRKEILRVLRPAGQGLAAAHGAGLLHRDFKPTNVLVGKEGRVCISDFGLAQLGDDAPEHASHGEHDELHGAAPASLSATLTRTGALVGTPAYMAPEQYEAGPLDARADQFSFCVTLYEAIYRQRPFQGRDFEELSSRVRRGEIKTPPKGRRCPAWLKRALLRGLAPRPEGRYPSMKALLVALRWGPYRARAQAAVLLLCLFGAVGTGASLHHRWAQQQVCREAETHFAADWNRGKGELAAAFSATGHAYAQKAALVTTKVLDEVAAEWLAQHKTACQPGSLLGSERSGSASAQLACLSDRRHEFETFVGLLAAADEPMVERAFPAAIKLSNGADCGVLLPARSSARAEPFSNNEEEVKLRQGLGEARALLLADRRSEALARLGPLLGRAHALGQPSLEEQAFALLGYAHPAASRAPAAISSPKETWLGLTYGDWSARWWQWAFSIPLDRFPLAREGTDECSVGQVGPVWFLGGVFFQMKPVPMTRKCTIEAGKSLFVAILSAECSTIPGDNSGNVTEDGLRSCARAFHDTPAVIKAQIDGEIIDGAADYRASSPLFRLALPEKRKLLETRLTASAGEYASVADGIYLMIKPLDPGPHSLHLYALAKDGFSVDVAYRLTVTP